jgi:hypothetical protein
LPINPNKQANQNNDQRRAVIKIQTRYGIDIANANCPAIDSNPTIVQSHKQAQFANSDHISPFQVATITSMNKFIQPKNPSINHHSAMVPTHPAILSTTMIQVITRETIHKKMKKSNELHQPFQTHKALHKLSTAMQNETHFQKSEGGC